MKDVALHTIKKAEHQNTINSYLTSTLNSLPYMASYHDVIKTYQDILSHKIIVEHFYHAVIDNRFDLINDITKISQLEACDRRSAIFGFIMEHFTIK